MVRDGKWTHEIHNKKNKPTRKASIKDLLIPRVICTGYEKSHYPNSPFSIDEILEVHHDGARLVSIKTGKYVDWLKFQNYPHLFKQLKWWEHREDYEMPLYIKTNTDYGGSFRVRKVTKWSCKNNSYSVMMYDGLDENFNINPNMIGYLPATEEEYIEFKNKQKSPH